MHHLAKRILAEYDRDFTVNPRDAVELAHLVMQSIGQYDKQATELTASQDAKEQ
jgi:hypothetical protein